MKQRIGFTSGVFDMFHIGHLNILKKSKELCSYLIVAVSTDEVVEQYKHHSPVIPFEQRAAIVAACKYVDEVVPQDTMNKIDIWKRHHFDVMFHGDDWKGSGLYAKYEEELKEVGVEVIYIPHTEGISSTAIREKIHG